MNFDFLTLWHVEDNVPLGKYFDFRPYEIAFGAVWDEHVHCIYVHIIHITLTTGELGSRYFTKFVQNLATLHLSLSHHYARAQRSLTKREVHGLLLPDIVLLLTQMQLLICNSNTSSLSAIRSQIYR